MRFPPDSSFQISLGRILFCKINVISNRPILGEDIQERGLQHFDDLLRLHSDLNCSTPSSPQRDGDHGESIFETKGGDAKENIPKSTSCMPQRSENPQ
jgi:hypothetical protein